MMNFEASYALSLFEQMDMMSVYYARQTQAVLLK